MEKNTSIVETKEGSQRLALEDSFPPDHFLPSLETGAEESTGGRAVACSSVQIPVSTIAFWELKSCENLVDPWKCTKCQRMLKHPKPRCTAFGILHSAS